MIATRHNLSPIFSLYEGDAWPRLGEVPAQPPWGEATDADGTVNRLWRVEDPAVHEAIAAELEDAELLIADGHHRYETAAVYADEIGGDGPHRYTLMCLVSLADPGLTIFGYHRLLSGLEDSARQEALADALRAHFEIEEVPAERLDPAGEDGVGVFGYMDSHFRRGFRLRLKDPGAADAALAGRSKPYRRLDAVILEELVLKGALGMSDEDIAAKRDLGYVNSVDDAVARLEDGSHQAAFLLRPVPVEQVRAVAAEGETMPPKTTFFYPKVPTGLVFNPLS
jgi:uncharacterized protein (DUF1015 family)